jgi:hypothetical protein
MIVSPLSPCCFAPPNQRIPHFSACEAPVNNISKLFPFNPPTASMSKLVEITSPSQFQSLLSSSKAVVVDCELP